MIIKALTARYLHEITAFTGHVTAEGAPEQRSTVPVAHQRSRNSLHAKIVALTEVPLVDEAIKNETFKLDDPRLEWVKNSVDFKAPEGKVLLTADRFVDGDVELTAGEKDFFKFCLRTRDEVPTVADEVLNEVDELVK